MIIKSIKLTNFRSHENYRLTCNKKTSLILGENGTGKTSVLEAIYIATCGKSFRAVDNDILKRDSEYYKIELDYNDGEKTIVTFSPNQSGVMKKQFLVDDKKTARLPKKNKYPIVLFIPDDLHLIDSSPTSKRDYFDRIISVLDDGYLNALSRYEKSLKQRNDLLKKMMDENNFDEGLLFSWNIMLTKYGTEIRNKRIEFINELNEKITTVYRSIAENSDIVSVKYSPQEDVNLDGILSDNDYLQNLSNSFKKDLFTGHTTYGVHRDNYEFVFNSKNAEGSASRGEVRSIILAMKFIEAELIFEKTNRKPIVLLDDVFSELDDRRQKALVKNFKENQVIITSVDGIE